MRTIESEPEKEMVRFLRSVLARDPFGATPCDLPPADRRADKVRQSCRREGLAEFVSKGSGKRWFITDKGLDWLNGREE